MSDLETTITIDHLHSRYIFTPTDDTHVIPDTIRIMFFIFLSVQQNHPHHIRCDPPVLEDLGLYQASGKGLFLEELLDLYKLGDVVGKVGVLRMIEPRTVTNVQILQTGRKFR